MTTTKTKKQTLSAKAIRILRKVEAHILEEPKRYDQNTICDRYTKKVIAERLEWGGDIDHIPPCRAIACIGGWVNVLTGHPRSQSLSLAARTLGLNHEQADRLFAGIDYDLTEPSCTVPYRQWPDRFQKAYFEAQTAAQRARVAVRRIEHFIKTGGAE